MKQTAVEWLAEQITTVKWKMSDITDRNSIIEKAKEMEKEQIMSAFDFGVYDGGGSIKKYKMSGEQYYNETFKSE